MKTDPQFLKLLTDEVIIQRLRVSRDNKGGFENYYETVATTYGRLSTRKTRGRERYNTEQDLSDVDYLLFLRLNTDIKRLDRVRCKGKVFEVTEVTTPSLQFHHTEATLKETQPELIVSLRGNLAAGCSLNGTLG